MTDFAICTTPTAPAACGWTHESDMARAVDRFNPGGPAGYRARSGGPLRATRAEAEMDECEAKHKPYCGDLCPFRTCSDDCPGRPREGSLSGRTATLKATPASAPTRNRGLTRSLLPTRRGL